MKVLVLGANGMLGHKLMQVLTKDGLDVVGTVRPKLDYYLRNVLSGIGTDDTSIRTALSQTSFDVVVNCIGLVKQRMTNTESSVLETIETNSVFPHRLLKHCQSYGVSKLIHLSTDCVFSGNRGHYTEGDTPDSTDLYGQSKSLGEIPNIPKVLTLRTSFIGKELQTKKGLLEWILAQKGKRAQGFVNVKWNGVSTLQLSKTISKIIMEFPDLKGLYHIASPHEVNKWWILDQLNTRLNLDIDLECSLSPTSFMTLDPSKFLDSTGIRIPDWYIMMEDLVEDLYESYNYPRN